MTIKNKTKVVDYKVYVAVDGKEFSSDTACKEYEKNRHLTKVFVLIEKGRNEKYVGTFSTEAKAQGWIDFLSKEFRDRFYIRPSYIDEKEI